MTLYNVKGTVVDLINADSPEAALAELRARLDRHGYTLHDDIDCWNAFESEPGLDEYLEDIAELVASLRFFHPDRYSD